MTGDAELTAGLSAFLSGRGLQVATRKQGAGPFDALAAEAPDALLLEMSSREDTMGFLTKLRANRLYAGLPTFLLADGEAAPGVMEKLSELHVVVVPRAEPVAALDEVLGVLFPLADGAERPG